MQIEELTKLGLTPGESKVYLSLLKIGPSTTGPITKKSKVAKSNIYEILERLIQKGLVSFIIKSKTKYFMANPPYNLKEYIKKKEIEIERQKQEIEKILPYLEKIQKTETNENAEIFLNKKGLKTAYEKMISGINKKEETLFFYIYDKQYGEEADLFYKSIWDLSKNLNTRGLANKEYEKSWFMKKAKNFQMKFVNFPIPGNIDIIGDHVLIVSWHPKIIGILINSKSIANHFREYFNKIWGIIK